MFIPDDSTDKKNTSGDLPMKFLVTDPDQSEIIHDRAWYRRDACKGRANKTFFKIDKRFKYPLIKTQYDENGVPDVSCCVPIEPKPDLSNRRITPADVTFRVGTDFSSVRVPEGYEAKMRLFDTVSKTMIECDLVQNDCRKTIVAMLDQLDERHTFVINVMNSIMFTAEGIDDEMGLLDGCRYGFEKKSGRAFLEIAATGERKYAALDTCKDFNTMEEEGMAAESETERDLLFIKEFYYNYTYNGHMKNRKIADYLFKNLNAFVEEKEERRPQIASRTRRIKP